MKTKTCSFFVIASLVFSVKMCAQDVEKSFVPYYLNDGKAQNFERIGAKTEAKAIGYAGFGGVNNYLTVFNSKYSEVRFNRGAIPKFIIRVDKGTDVFELVVISKADVVKKKKTYRRFINGGSSYGGGSKDLSKYITIPKLKKIKGNMYEIVINEELESGEYAFQPIYKGVEAANIRSTSGSVRIYCFGVD